MPTRRRAAGQAVAVCLYECIREDGAVPERAPFEGADGTKAEQITSMLREVLERSGYTNRITSVSTNEKMRRWVRRLRISRRDAPLVMGVLRQILWKFDQSGKD